VVRNSLVKTIKGQGIKKILFNPFHKKGSSSITRRLWGQDQTKLSFVSVYTEEDILLL
jgi:hypothetical protein